MFSAGPGGAWSQDAVRPFTSQEKLALRKKNERANTAKLWARLELLAPKVKENTGQLGGHRSEALRGRTKEELLKDIMHAVRMAQGLHSENLVLAESE